MRSIKNVYIIYYIWNNYAAIKKYPLCKLLKLLEYHITKLKTHLDKNPRKRIIISLVIKR